MGDHDNSPVSRRTTLQTIAASTVGSSMIGVTTASPSTEDELPGGGGGGCTYPCEYSLGDEWVGVDPSGHETRLCLGSGLVEYSPVWRSSVGDGKWELDYVVSMTSDNRHTSDGTVAKEMFYHSKTINNFASSTDVYSRDDPDWIGSTGRGSGGYDYVNDQEVADGIGTALSALNPLPGGDYIVTEFTSELAYWWLSQDNDSYLYRKWDYGGIEHEDVHKAGTHLMFRIEVDENYSDTMDVQTTSVSSQENVGVNTFYMSFSTGSAPNAITTADQQQLGVERVEADDVRSRGAKDLGISRAMANDIVENDDTAYVARNARFTTISGASGVGSTREKAEQL